MLISIDKNHKTSLLCKHHDFYYNRKLLDRYLKVMPISFDRYRYILACTVKLQDLSLIILHFLIILFLFASMLWMWYLKKCSRMLIKDSNVKENVNLQMSLKSTSMLWRTHKLEWKIILINLAYQTEFLRWLTSAIVNF